MLGAIIGDIVGSRFEFNPTNDYNFELFTPECSFTDDTICTIAVADALLHSKDYGQTIHEWCRRYPHPMGGYGGRFAQWVKSDNPQPYNSFGNGAAMRVSALGWLPNAIGASYAVEQATACTHNHPEGIKGAMTVARAIHDCLQMHGVVNHIDRDTILEEGLKTALKYSGYDINIDINKVQNRFDETCQGTVPVALWIITESHSFEDAIRKAVSLGADADTLGAIVGGIAEAIWGIPEWMKKKAVKYLPDDMREILNEFRKTSVWHLTKTVKDEQAKQEAEELNQFKAIMFWKLSLGNPNVAMGLAPSPEEQTTPATADMWPDAEKMPKEDITSYKLNMSLTSEQVAKLRMGHIPAAQEDHWFMYMDDQYIRYYRSWTGMCAFEAHYVCKDDSCTIDILRINRQLAEFGVNGDQAGLALFQYLIVAETGGNAEQAWQDYLAAWTKLYYKYKK